MLPTDLGDRIPPRSSHGALLDCVDTIRVEGEMVLDLGDRGVRRLIGPDGIHRSLPAKWMLEEATVALEGQEVAGAGRLRNHKRSEGDNAGTQATLTPRL